jgi:hypothetical protein
MRVAEWIAAPPSGKRCRSLLFEDFSYIEIAITSAHLATVATGWPSPSGATVGISQGGLR